MSSRKQSAEILYPFIPASDNYRDFVKGILDAFFVVSDMGSLPVTGTPPPGAHPEYYTMLQQLDITATQVIFTFRITTPEHKLIRTFTVPLFGGIMRVNSNESPLCWVLVNAERLYALPGTYSIEAVLEPARTVYQLDKVNSIRLVNEYRDYDPRTRLESIKNNPDKTIFYTTDPDSVLSLVDGHNCSLEYDEEQGILYINGGPGLGKGLPTDMPWDNDKVLDIFHGIKSINGQNVNSSVQIEFKNSLRPDYEKHRIDVKIVDWN